MWPSCSLLLQTFSACPLDPIFLIAQNALRPLHQTNIPAWYPFTTQEIFIFAVSTRTCTTDRDMLTMDYNSVIRTESIVQLGALKLVKIR